MMIISRAVMYQVFRVIGLACLMGIMATLTACRTDLYSQLSEADANEILTTLRGASIEASKEAADGGKGWRIAVADEHVVRAMNLLRESGLPKKAHANLGELFKKDGMVSSPTEDKVRFLHGVSQELSETLSRIDGVVTARVHIVLPDNDPRNRQQTPSSASVFMKHHPSINVSTFIPSVRQLVARSIEGLDPERVSVTLVPAQLVFEAPPERSENSRWLWLVLAGLLTVVVCAGAGYAYVRQNDGPARDALKWPSLNTASPATPGVQA